MALPLVEQNGMTWSGRWCNRKTRAMYGY